MSSNSLPQDKHRTFTFWMLICGARQQFGVDGAALFEGSCRLPGSWTLLSVVCESSLGKDVTFLPSRRLPLGDRTSCIAWRCICVRDPYVDMPVSSRFLAASMLASGMIERRLFMPFNVICWSNISGGKELRMVEQKLAVARVGKLLLSK